MAGSHGSLFLRTTLTEAANHLRQKQRRLQHIAGGEAASEAAKESGSAWRVVEPPHVMKPTDAINVNVLRRDEFEESQSSVRSAQPALLHSAPRSLRDAVRIEHFVDHHRASF